MVKSLVSKLSSASSNISLSSTLSSVSASLQGVGGGGVGVGVQETNYLKHRNDPGRFFGDGVQFKAKLIGILEVGEARGDRMCQEALQDLKMAIRAAGEHKQRITIHVTIDGLRLRDEKTGDSLYHHPVHKISFIAQDMTDSRAFGYIFGSPDSGHRFFGIKTDKAASQVVLAMRDLFQVVFELKKKEIELARQQIQSKSIHDHSTLSSLASMKTTGSGQNDLSGGGAVTNSSVMLSSSYIGTAGSNIKIAYSVSDPKTIAPGHIKEMSPESVADLVDLEQELNSIQRGITQMERITPSDPTPTLGSSTKAGAGDEDPFGDSFSIYNFPTYNLLPPPESSRSRAKPNKPPDLSGRGTTITAAAAAHNIGGNVSGRVAMLVTAAAPAGSNSLSSGASPANLHQDDDDSWLQELDQQNDVFDTSKTGFLGMGLGLSAAPLAPCETISTPTNSHLAAVGTSSFEGPTMRMGSVTSTPADAVSISSQSDQTQSLPQTLKSETGAAARDPADIDPSKITGTEAVMLPRDTDPFSPTRKKSDPFQEVGDLFSNMDPFEFEFPAANDSKIKSAKQQEQHTSPATSDAKKSTDVFNGPLQVSLPPESSSSTSHQKSAPSQWKPPPNERSEASAVSVMGNHTSIRSRPTPSAGTTHLQMNSASMAPSTSPSSSSVFKQQTVDVISSISNKKMPHLFGQATRFSKRDSNNINMRRLQESDSLSENEAAPEPPPRPDSALHVEPPPLPPKKQFSDIVIRPRSISSAAAATVGASSRYEFLSSGGPTKSSASGRIGGGGGGGGDVPPIPLPSRRVGRSDGTYPGPGRPRKPGHTDDDYLAPIENISLAAGGLPPDVPPPLLPPPTQISTRAPRAQRQQSAIKPQDIYENKLEIMQQHRSRAATETASSAINPDITLSQLLTLGIDDLALKLNVPTSKLNTMTLVELTAYLAEFIERSTKPATSWKELSQTGSEASSLNNLKEVEKSDELTAIFKVNFDQEATFVATFDDNFGEDHQSTETAGTFCANFAQFNESSAAVSSSNPAVPPADRYAVFREIIDQELQQNQEENDLIGDMLSEDVEDSTSLQQSVLGRDSTQLAETPGSVDRKFLAKEPQVGTLPKFDTKITEVVAQAKDRYAALRDIILVENLFDKQAIITGQEAVLGQGFAEFEDELNEEQERDREVCSSALSVGDDDDEDDDDEDGDGAGESSLDSNEKGSGGIGSDRCCELVQDQYEKLSTSNQQLEVERSEQYNTNGLANAKQDSKFLMVAGGTCGQIAANSRDDLEIDELMQRAISNLSLDSRERISPASTAAPTATTTAKMDATTTKKAPRSAHNGSPALAPKSQFNDVSTSPIPGPPQQNQIPKVTPPQLSPIPTQLAAVSSLIDTASKQICLDQGAALSKESWATFDSPKPTTFPTAISVGKSSVRSQKASARRRSKSPKAITLHLPPPPPSNTSQNDTAESPCSSDPRDDGWAKSGGRRWTKQDRSSGGIGSNAPQTSSSSRDASPWDDETGPESYSKQRRERLTCSQQQQHAHSDRHGYYMRHARRMNSCDEDYEYEGEFIKRRDRDRDHRKFKQGISRSRDNFEFDSSTWYHHPHHSWSPQDDEPSVGVNSRARSFDRSVYERSTYGPSVYDKRAAGLASATSSYDRRAGGGYDKRKYYRDYSRPNYDFDGYSESPPPHQDRRVRRDYENIYEPDNRSFMGYGGKVTRAVDYGGYECDRKSFDRESVESYESATHRRRSFGSGDVYGSLESREEFRDRYIGVSPDAKATRSLRKSGLKSLSRNAPADIGYDQDSDVNEFHQQQRSIRGPPPLDSRSLQRPSQLGSIGSIGGGGQQRLRKSSGSSPWDGEEPAPHMGGSAAVQSSSGLKAWKRPSSAAESERRIAESRRAAALAQTPSGSDGEKDRRFRRKQRLRGKELLPVGVSAANRYIGSGQNAPPHTRDNYDYMTYANDDDDVDDDDYADEEYEEPPTDEDKFERLNRRRHEMHQRMLESEQRRQHSTKCKPSSGVKSLDAAGNIKYHASPRASEFADFEDIQASVSTPRSGEANVSSPSAAATIATKFNFDDQSGFESDFNQSTSPPPPPAGTASSCNSTPAAAAAPTTFRGKSSFRFSNDFSEREKLQSFAASNTASLQHSSELVNQKASVSPAISAAEHSTPPPVVTQKLRFDDNVKISKFDNNVNSTTFEDDFSKADFDFEKADQWSAEAVQAARSMKKTQMRSSKLQQRQDLIKKSESINIFAKKSEDPFEDDEFFNAPDPLSSEDVTRKQQQQQSTGAGGTGVDFQWDDSGSNFAKFDENM